MFCSKNITVDIEQECLDCKILALDIKHEQLDAKFRYLIFCHIWPSIMNSDYYIKLFGNSATYFAPHLNIFMLICL